MRLAVTCLFALRIALVAAMAPASSGGVPGLIEAEDYASWLDTTPGNSGRQYREDDVDIGAIGDGGFYVGWITAGEWVEYGVAIESAGEYDIILKIAAVRENASLHVEIDGVDVTGPFRLPYTGGWLVWTMPSLGPFSLQPGTHVMRVVMETGGFNLDWLHVSGRPRHDWRLVWSDEFEGSGLPDPTRWTYDVAEPGWVDDELQAYTANRLENAKVEDGMLVIQARRDSYQGYEYSSARLKTLDRGDWCYGRFEIRAQLPRGRGTFPAISMLPTRSPYGDWPDSGEIDIMEHLGYDQGWLHASTHSHTRNRQRDNQETGLLDVPNCIDAFHVYVLEWLPDRIQVFVDDRSYFVDFRSENDSPNEWPFEKPFHLILNIAVGGTRAGEEGVDTSIWPQHMDVDYVRVYQSELMAHSEP
jgi:beta-glucanase (GH16 family)